MSPADYVVPFAVFTDYRNRRSRGAVITDVSPATDPEKERIPS